MGDPRAETSERNQGLFPLPFLYQAVFLIKLSFSFHGFGSNGYAHHDFMFFQVTQTP